MRIKNLERAFGDRMIEINNIYALKGIDSLTYEQEKLYAEVALTQLKKDRNYELWNRFFENSDIKGYEHDKKLYSLIIDFARYSNVAVQEIAQRLGISEGEVVSAAELRSEQLKKRLGKK